MHVVFIQLLCHGQTFVTPWTATHRASLSFTIFWSLSKLLSIKLVMPSPNLILCHFVLLHFVLQSQICLLFQVSLISYFCIPIPCDEKDIFFWWLSSRRSCRSSQTFNFSFFGISSWDIHLDYCDNEWFALEINRSFCCF